MKGKIDYRLDDPYWSLVSADAKRHKMSPDLYARLILVQHYEHVQVLDLQDRVESMQRVVEQKLDSFRSAFEAALE